VPGSSALLVGFAPGPAGTASHTCVELARLRPDIGYDVTSSGALLSQLTGVLAAVIFAGVILLIGYKPEEEARRYPSQAIAALSVAFLMLIMASFLFAAVAGDAQRCERANAEDTLAGALFAGAAAQMFLSIVWLVLAFPAVRGSARLFKLLLVLVGLIAELFIAMSVSDTVNLFEGDYWSSGRWVRWAAYSLAVAVSVAAIGPVGRRWLSGSRWPTWLFQVNLGASLAFTFLAAVGFAVLAEQRTVSERTLFPGWAKAAILLGVAVLVGLAVANALVASEVEDHQPAPGRRRRGPRTWRTLDGSTPQPAAGATSASGAGSEVAPRVRRVTVTQRMGEHLGQNHLMLISIVKGVTLGNAGLTIAEVLGRVHEQRPQNATILVLLAASLVATVLTYSATTIGALVVFWVPGVIDTVVPLGIGICEFLMFSVLRADGPDAVAPYWYWFPLAMLLGLLACSILVNVLSKLNAERDYEAGLQPAIEEHRRSQRSDAIVSFLSALGWGGVFVYAHVVGSARAHLFAFGVGSLVLLLGAYVHQEQTRRRLASHLGLPATSFRRQVVAGRQAGPPGSGPPQGGGASSASIG
jgi:hypothetical protein